MWNRKEIKAAGKAAFKANYWRCVLVAFILTLIAGVVGGVSGLTSSTTAMMGSLGAFSGDQFMNVTVDEDGVDFSSEIGDIIDGDIANEIQDEEISFYEIQSDPAAAAKLMNVLMIAAMPMLLFGIAVTILVLNPFTVSYSRFFLQNSRKTKAEPYDGSDLNELGYGYTHRFGRNVLTMFLRDLFMCLWTLMFIIPGLVKSYSYRMVPYILSDNEDMSATEAITKSREIMNGNKWRAFVLDLSFIGWVFLSCITLGLVGIFYVAPYISATEAELYEAIKD